MKPLHLRYSAWFSLQNGSRRTRRSWRISGLILLASVAGASAQDKPADKTQNAGAQPPPVVSVQPPVVTPQPPPVVAVQPPIAAPQPAAPSVNFRERPRYPADPQRLRRTPVIDGALSDGEWDPFYTITDGAIKGTFYCNWDDNFLYLAARTDAPSTVLFDVDTGGDGWLRGSDNLEIVVGSVMDGGSPTVVTRLLDAANSKDTPTWNEKAVDPKTIVVAEKIVNGTQVLELAIPRNAASLVPRVGAAIGLRAEFLPPMPASAYVPTAAFEPHLLVDASLTEARVVAVSGINPKLTLSDYKCIAGETLFATLELLNQSDLSVGIKTVTWGGVGVSADAVDTYRDVNVKPILGNKRLKLGYKTVLPERLSVGSYMLNVKVDLDNGKEVQSATAFTIVEPVQVQMSTDPDPVSVLGQTKLTAIVDVFSAVPNHFKGDVELITIPTGWTVDGSPKQGLEIDREDARHASRFSLKVPSNTMSGDYTLEAVVTWHGKKWNARTVAHVTRAEPPPVTTPATPAPGAAPVSPVPANPAPANTPPSNPAPAAPAGTSTN